jgi:hypothetical protein
MKRTRLVPLLLGAFVPGVFAACTGNDPERAEAACAEGTICGPGLVCVSSQCVIAEGGIDSGSDGAEGRKRVADSWAAELVAYWPFDGDALDYSGHRLDLDVSDVSFEPGAVTGALRRSATSLVKRPIDDPALALGDDVFTIEFWLYLEDSANGVLMSKLDPLASGGWAIDRLNIYDGEQLNFTVFDDGGLNGGGLGPSLFVTTWTHYALVRRESGGVSMYRNGALENQAVVDVVASTSAPFRFGESVSNPSRNFIGKIDELAIWKRALSTTEVAVLYNEGKGRSLFER